MNLIGSCTEGEPKRPIYQFWNKKSSQEREREQELQVQTKWRLSEFTRAHFRGMVKSFISISRETSLVTAALTSPSPELSWQRAQVKSKKLCGIEAKPSRTIGSLDTWWSLSIYRLLVFVFLRLTYGCALLSRFLAHSNYRNPAFLALANVKYWVFKWPTCLLR